MKTFALASLLAALALSPASAEPAPAAKPAPAACLAKGVPLFELDHDADAKAKVATSKTAIYESGAWTTTALDADGKPQPPASGCLDKATVDKLRAELVGAPWKIVHNQIHCMAYSPSYTVYRHNGKELYKARMCSPDVLDDKSSAALQRINDQIEKGVGKPLAPAGEPTVR